MAKKPSKKNSKKNIKKNIPFMEELSWILYIFLATFITLSIYTHNILDPSFNRSSTDTIKNIFGKLGSYFSDILFQLFGITAYIIPVFIIAFLIKKTIMREKSISFFYSLGTIFSVSIISGVVALSETYNGGIIGKLISKPALYILNPIGSYLFLSLLLLALLILMFHIPIVKIVRYLFVSIAGIFLKLFILLKNHVNELREEKVTIKEKNKLEKEKEKRKKELEKIKERQTKELEKERLKHEKELEKERLKQEKELEKERIKQATKLEKEKIKQLTKLEKEKIKQEKELEKLKNSSSRSNSEDILKKDEEVSEKIVNEDDEIDLNENSDEKKIKNLFNDENIEEVDEKKKKGFGFLKKIKNISHKDAENFIIDRPEKPSFVMYSDERIIDDVFEEEDTPPPMDSKENENENENKTKINSSESKKSNSVDNSVDNLKDDIKEKDTKVEEKVIKDVIETQEFVKDDGIKIQVSKPLYSGDNFSNFQEENKAKSKVYTLPPIQFLKYEKAENEVIDTDLLNRNAEAIKETLKDFKINNTAITEIFKGPTLTTYELSIPKGIKISKVIGFSEEIASSLKVNQVRMVPIHKKGVIGVEVPNKKREIVWLKEILNTKEYQESAKKSKLTVVLGKDISGNAIVANLAKMPHLLIAGTTGSGKSVFTNVLVTSILYNATADEVKFILIDPKMLEFSIYNDIPNLLFPVIIDPKKAAYALNWAVDEMERRYGLISEFSERDITSYNKKAKIIIEKGVPEEIQNKIDELAAIRKDILEDEELSDHEIDTEIAQINRRIEGIMEKYKTPEILPYIVVVLDEYADLMMVASKEVETSIARIAQKARAAGIHLVIATQRPDKDVVTGLIKANLPVRVALSVKGATNSKIILDENGAEKLLGYGDMLYLGPGTSQLNRIQSPLITSDEQNNILAFLREQGSPTYGLDVLDQYNTEEEDDFPVSEEEKDAKYKEAVKIAVDMKKVSASYLQRRLKVGYNRAARMVEIMEKEGIVGPPNGSKPRELLKIPDNFM